MNHSHHYVAIMAGGIGSRFWPKSRTAYPKQFLDILNTGQSLLQWTYRRYAAFLPEENIFVVTSEEYTGIVAEQLPGMKADNILSEPSRKNTAPCIAYISFKLQQMDPEACLIVAPSDHLILDEERFKQTTLQALHFVETVRSLVTLGITPTHPNTGYGYIQHEPLPVAEGIYKVKTFTEKPDIEFEKHQPEMFELFDAEKKHFNTPGEVAAIHRIYPLCTNISIDNAIMEKAGNVYVIPSSFGWSDLGTWNSAYDNLEKDYLGNAVAGDSVMIIDATRCMVSVPDKKLLVLQGVDDCIIVDTPDALMICKKEKEQSIKEYVAEVKRNIGDGYL